MKAAKYYIKFGISNNPNAGSKAMRDIMHLLDTRGYKCMPALPATAPKVLKLLDIPILVAAVLFAVRSKGTVMYFVPSNCSRISLLARLRNLLGFRLICFVNDVEFLRMDLGAQKEEQELAAIRCADIIMAPNDQSVRILRDEYSFTNRMVPVGMWDYLTPPSVPFCKEPQNDHVAYAGNLAKAPFIASLGEIDLTFELWGRGDVPDCPNVIYKGLSMPDQMIPNVAPCKWGLVWDGSSIDTCDGLLGRYLRFNSAHKCALYLASGLPVIVWEESGLAGFVRENNAGFAVKSLKEASEKIKSVSDEEYAHMRENAYQAGLKNRRGQFFLDALSQIEG